jgi:hypothetical protein
MSHVTSAKRQEVNNWAILNEGCCVHMSLTYNRYPAANNLGNEEEIFGSINNFTCFSHQLHAILISLVTYAT